MTSPRRSPSGDDASPIPPPSPHEKPPSKPQTPARQEDADPPSSPLRSTLPLPSNGAAEEPPPPPSSMAIVIANRLTREADVSGDAKVVGGGNRSPRRGDRGLGFQPAVVRRPRVEKAAAGLRVAALVLCTIAFSVMASDRTEGWAGDSFDRYKEFRYLVGVNVIGFVYSLFQVYEQIRLRKAMTYVLGRRIHYYLDFSMDQILAYLLMSTSSAAASCIDVWVSRFGSDGFTRKANASIVTSFLAFIVLALSSIISAHDLFRFTR